LDQAAREGAALVELPRGILEATGPKRVEFLQGMLSNDVVRLVPGQGCRAALLDVKGHVQSLMRALATADAIHLEMPQDRLSLVLGFLNHHKVAAPVRFRPADEAVLALVGPKAPEVLARAGAAPPPPTPESHASAVIGGRDVLLVTAGDLPARGLCLHLAREGGPDVAAALLDAGATSLEAGALDALRIEEGRAWFGPDVTDENLLHETGQEPEYASFTKGCYVGQEVVARLAARGGHVNKALRGLRLEAPTNAGAAVRAESAVVGRVTTAAVSPRLGPIAMAYVHRSHFEPGTRLEVEGVAATVASLPLG
jgi:folate-binding protein YgfZ